MKKLITRRDFLKLAGLLPLGIATSSCMSSLPVHQTENSQNILIIVFDAFSAYHISLYGYQRETTPNISRLAERAIVYHNHYAGGNYTTPGTASLLTGTLPWTHRAFQQGGPVDESFVHKNIFSAFQNHYRVAYSHNLWVYTFLNQFKRALDQYIPLEEYLLGRDNFIPNLFRYDADIATVAWNRIIQNYDDGYAYSLFLSDLYKEEEFGSSAKSAQYKELYPRGVPKTQHFPFLLEQAIDSIGELLSNLRQPFLGYFHFWPPHDPYNTHRDFFHRFQNDGYKPVPKPLDIFHEGEFSADIKSVEYDEFILYLDQEFGNFYDHLAAEGLVDNTWIILTSDHGELFERGVIGHSTPLLYEPVIRIPLMIFEPGRNTRLDIHTPTSAIDILPTLLHVTGQPLAEWAEGVVMPPFSDSTLDENRNIFVLEAKKNGKNMPLTTATVALIKGNYKIMNFSGYEELRGKDRIELYNIENDPEEINDLYSTKRDTADELLHDLKTKLVEANKPFLQVIK
ncbi:MAG: sulfatase-like hydrolase/transferase [Anaerolineales bacterium]